ncbi:MAG: YigZ family protein [Tissierellia bacterium]|nr:YigZ family protein [Tissierellia bacterium]
MSIYKSIHRYGIDEVTIQKSLFIGQCLPVESDEEASAFIEKVKGEHKTATHNCYGYVVGEQIQRFSDDGEPMHTAGMPILNLLMAQDLRNVCVVVTRYFGGILLGKGGLVRAYTEGTKIALDRGKVVEKEPYHTIQLGLDYGLLGPVENYILNQGLYVAEKEYTEEVKLTLYIPERDYERRFVEFMNLTSGKAVVLQTNTVIRSTFEGSLYMAGEE